MSIWRVECFRIIIRRWHAISPSSWGSRNGRTLQYSYCMRIDALTVLYSMFPTQYINYLQNSLPLDSRFTSLFIQEDIKKLQSQIKQPLNIKAERIYLTPLRHGFVVLYQSSNENVLRFSRNRLDENSISDFLMLNTIQFKMNYDDSISDVVWQKSVNVGAIIGICKIYIVDSNLKTLRTISLMPHIN